MPSDRANHIIALAARLEEDDVLWDEVDLHVADFPGWSQVVQMWRTPARNPNTRIVSMGSPNQYVYVSSAHRNRMLQFFKTVCDHPGRLEIAGRASDRPADAGWDARRFCADNRRDGDAEVAAAATAVFEACKSKATLLSDR